MSQATCNGNDEIYSKESTIWAEGSKNVPREQYAVNDKRKETKKYLREEEQKKVD